MKAALLLTLLVAVSDFASVSAICSGGCSYKCPKINFAACPYGKAGDACHCCYVCGKGPGELCNPAAYECGTNMHCAHVYGYWYACKKLE
ncbi:insulin-like growth factor-binding protein 7 [Penaeus chinensis]|uniref:insulin-like growth factor-binding protein 7 n=1 Tax=Penaeus chinensis TaxID=139456 RepID=UPI001FB841C2|nr:insulin-like growth factor-binding protein 7 [Penaeus chinensis]